MSDSKSHLIGNNMHRRNQPIKFSIRVPKVNAFNINE